MSGCVIELLAIPEILMALEKKGVGSTVGATDAQLSGTLFGDDDLE